MIVVYHAANPWPPFFGFYSVAAVHTNDPEEAFRLTNHIDHDWTLNPQVTMFVDSPIRSTSVGDVLVSDTQILQVAASGFTELDFNNFVKMIDIYK